jgi:hypothetical protein
MSIKLTNIFAAQLLLKEEYKVFLKNYLTTKTHYFCPIEETINYNTILSNDYSLYDEWLINTKQLEHSSESFKKLINEFDINKMEPIDIYYNYELKKYIINDGLHRICILYFKKLINDSIPISLLNISFDSDTINSIKDNLIKTTTTYHYNGWNNRTSYGYHSFNICNIDILGQRRPKMRIDEIQKHISFDNKTVFDFGCNTGGMLLHTPTIKNGYGFDFDSNCINSCNYIKNILNYNNNLNFIVQDLNNFNLFEFLSKENINIDISYLLSIGSWVQNWKQLYENVLKASNIIILETNNDKEGLPQLELFKYHNCDIKCIIDNSLDDTTNNNLRKTYLITKL